MQGSDRQQSLQHPNATSTNAMEVLAEAARRGLLNLHSYGTLKNNIEWEFQGDPSRKETPRDGSVDSIGQLRPIRARHDDEQSGRASLGKLAQIIQMGRLSSTDMPPGAKDHDEIGPNTLHSTSNKSPAESYTLQRPTAKPNLSQPQPSQSGFDRPLVSHTFEANPIFMHQSRTQDSFLDPKRTWDGGSDLSSQQQPHSEQQSSTKQELELLRILAARREGDLQKACPRSREQEQSQSIKLQQFREANGHLGQRLDQEQDLRRLLNDQIERDLQHLKEAHRELELRRHLSAQLERNLEDNFGTYQEQQDQHALGQQDDVKLLQNLLDARQRQQELVQARDAIADDNLHDRSRHPYLDEQTAWPSHGDKPHQQPAVRNRNDAYLDLVGLHRLPRTLDRQERSQQLLNDALQKRQPSREQLRPRSTSMVHRRDTSASREQQLERQVAMQRQIDSMRQHFEAAGRSSPTDGSYWQDEIQRQQLLPEATAASEGFGTAEAALLEMLRHASGRAVPYSRIDAAHRTGLSSQRELQPRDTAWEASSSQEMSAASDLQNDETEHGNAFRQCAVREFHDGAYHWEETRAPERPERPMPVVFGQTAQQPQRSTVRERDHKARVNSHSTVASGKSQDRQSVDDLRQDAVDQSSGTDSIRKCSKYSSNRISIDCEHNAKQPHRLSQTQNILTSSSNKQHGISLPEFNKQATEQQRRRDFRRRAFFQNALRVAADSTTTSIDESKDSVPKRKSSAFAPDRTKASRAERESQNLVNQSAPGEEDERRHSRSSITEEDSKAKNDRRSVRHSALGKLQESDISSHIKSSSEIDPSEEAADSAPRRKSSNVKSARPSSKSMPDSAGKDSPSRPGSRRGSRSSQQHAEKFSLGRASSLKILVRNSDSSSGSETAPEDGDESERRIGPKSSSIGDPSSDSRSRNSGKFSGTNKLPTEKNRDSRFHDRSDHHELCFTNATDDDETRRSTSSKASFDIGTALKMTPNTGLLRPLDGGASVDESTYEQPIQQQQQQRRGSNSIGKHNKSDSRSISSDTSDDTTVSAQYRPAPRRPPPQQGGGGGGGGGGGVQLPDRKLMHERMLARLKELPDSGAKKPEQQDKKDKKRGDAVPISQLKLAQGGATQVNPNDTLSEEDLEACKTRAEEKKVRRRKKTDEANALPMAPPTQSERRSIGDGDEGVLALSRDTQQAAPIKATAARQPQAKRAQIGLKRPRAASVIVYCRTPCPVCPAPVARNCCRQCGVACCQPVCRRCCPC